MASSKKRKISYKCPFCTKKYLRENLPRHLDDVHKEEIPEGFSPLRYTFHYINKRPLDYHGRCTECKGPTPWDEEIGRYKRQCGKQACHDSYVKKFEENMVKKTGHTRNTDTEEGLQNMLKNRKISGKYKFQNGKEKEYVGSYEKNCLEFMDKVMNIDPDDIMSPGPTLEYQYDGKTHYYITDFYYIPYNLIIEVKDGGKNPNNRNMPEYREKQIAKEKFIVNNTDYNYLRLTDNNLAQLLAVFADLKMQLVDESNDRVVHINESAKVNLKNIYFISTRSDFNGKTVSPRVPDNYFTKNGYEDNTTKRICFCPTIDQCLTALSKNCTGMEAYVYQPDDISKYDLYRPSINEVPDVKITGEVWITEPVKVKCIGKIHCTGDTGEDGIEYTYGDNKKAKLYKWNWEWIEQLNEGYVINQKDILYNKDKFESGEINLCFVTGLSGSGKSTLANNMEKNGVEKYELDDLFANYNFSDDNLKEYGDLIYSFFKGIGKKYRMNEQPSEENNWLNDTYNDEFEKGMLKDFIKHSMNYAKSHKKSKFVIEGVEMYWFLEPSELKDYAVYIKGTSALISMIRGSSRDASNDGFKGGKKLLAIIKSVFRADRAKAFAKTEKTIKKWRDYFTNLEKKQETVKESKLAAIRENGFAPVDFI